MILLIREEVELDLYDAEKCQCQIIYVWDEDRNNVLDEEFIRCGYCEERQSRRLPVPDHVQDYRVDESSEHGSDYGYPEYDDGYRS